jgi:putative chitinase
MDAATFKRATGCTLTLANKWFDAATAAMALYGIDTPLRQAHFLAQCGHETMGFVYSAELWGPTPQQLKYDPASGSALSKELGNTQIGDGARFKGRGWIMRTGRANYDRLSKSINIDVVTSPELVEQPSLSVVSACEFWCVEHNINALADKDDIVSVTKVVNGGQNGIDDRKIRLALAKGVLL